MNSPYHFGVVGEHISYSKSADIFKAAFATIGENATCDLISIRKEQLASTLERVREGYYRGLSITIPHKVEVIQYLDQVDNRASILGAVNSICMNDGRLTGYNTDVDGFLYPIQHLKESDTPLNALVLGYGGAAAAVVHALANALAFDRVVIAGREQERLSQFRSRMLPLVADCELQTILSGELGQLDTSDIDIIINCTPLGGPLYPNEPPLPNSFRWPKGKHYYDLSYNPNNLAVAVALQNGLETIDGSTMLVAQALKSLELWTGHKFEVGPIYEEVF